MRRSALASAIHRDNASSNIPLRAFPRPRVRIERVRITPSPRSTTRSPATAAPRSIGRSFARSRASPRARTPTRRVFNTKPRSRCRSSLARSRRVASRRAHLASLHVVARVQEARFMGRRRIARATTRATDRIVRPTAIEGLSDRPRACMHERMNDRTTDRGRRSRRATIRRVRARELYVFGDFKSTHICFRTTNDSLVRCSLK